MGVLKVVPLLLCCGIVLSTHSDEIRINDIITRLSAVEIRFRSLQTRMGQIILNGGIRGRDGVRGPRGPPGKDGTNGVDGAQGAAGSPGSDGSAGSDGAKGPAGPAGPAGPKGERGPGSSSGGSGAVYTRWGRKTCGRGSDLLYEGFAGNTHYTHIGGGVNYQCLPLTPQFHSSGVATLYGGIYGVEYQTHKFGIFPNSAHDQNVPCARCYTKGRSATMMIPAMRTCKTGWHKEYEGYLMTSYHSHAHPSTYECVDANPEYIAGQHANNDGGLFYFVRIGCPYGGHCPPYNGRQSLTCVVCSK